MVGRKALPQAHRRLWLSTGLVLLLLALAAAWRWTDLGSWLDPQTLSQSLAGVLHGPWGPGLLMLAYLVGSLLAVPVTLLILLTALIYGPALGAFYALTGSLLAATATYGIGAYLGGPTVIGADTVGCSGNLRYRRLSGWSHRGTAVRRQRTSPE
jgi:uncharacterized membrane protein YdjX (TVP38/TMEM64 family)